ncbi:uncharacterized protein LOC120458523 [Drosophila santomea]|uniref:uncharacterized protein LOC120458523 n=1 Tax=Drosophila santomea TaxID=129105 RepID=UPI001952CD76|nr:uncharacterized protein LOC120458523 [Drosophila santomea]
MSPKFALAILLLSCVLLGMANAQQNRRSQQSRPPRPNIGPRMNQDGSLPPNYPPPAEDAVASGGSATVDCVPNLLAGNIRDTRKPRPKP